MVIGGHDEIQLLHRQGETKRNTEQKHELYEKPISSECSKRCTTKPYNLVCS